MNNDIEDLENIKTIKAYRTAQVINNKVYPSMSAKVSNELRNPIIFGTWERSVEDPQNIKKNGKYTLDKSNGSKIEAVYNPYFHTSNTVLNDQFSSAQNRNNLVVLEVEIPLDEINGEIKYKADKAHDSIGKKEWKAGILQSKLSGTRTVYLTRYDKPLRILSNEEVAKKTSDLFPNKNCPLPTNVFYPSLKKEMILLGHIFIETDNKGIIAIGKDKGKSWSSVYGDTFVKKEKKDIKMNQTYFNYVVACEDEHFKNEIKQAITKYHVIGDNLRNTLYNKNISTEKEYHVYERLDTMSPDLANLLIKKCADENYIEKLKEQKEFLKNTSSIFIENVKSVNSNSVSDIENKLNENISDEQKNKIINKTETLSKSIKVYQQNNNSNKRGR